MTTEDLKTATRAYATGHDGERFYYDFVTREPISLVVGGGMSLAWHAKVRRAGDKYDAGGCYPLSALHADFS